MKAVGISKVIILPSGSVCFAIKGKKWPNRLSKAFAIGGNIDTTSLKCESTVAV